VIRLHALPYCRLLVYVEEVEEIRRADAPFYAGSVLRASLDAVEDGVQSQLEKEQTVESGQFARLRHR
jgi:hypothetical protein